MSKWEIQFHPDFFKDIDKLSNKEIQIFEKKKEKIKQNPIRLKHLKGGENCYREAITSHIRLVYYIKNSTIWMLTINKHDKAYETYLKRLHSLKQKYFR